MKVDRLATDAVVMQELGRRLERTRLDANMTQRQLADHAGIGKATLERLEAGEGAQMTTFIRVLRALGLVDVLDDLIPERRGPSPLEVVTRRQQRQRAARSAASRRVYDNPRQPWGDES